MNNAKDPTKPSFDHLSNFKEYSNSTNQSKL